jgi:hypothetical protein
MDPLDRNTARASRSARPWRRLAAALVIGLVLLGSAPAQAVNVEDHQGYNSEYLFSFTRGVVDSTMATPVKSALFLITIPVDIVLLPVTALVGIFA